jgi:hypothetical protein
MDDTELVVEQLTSKLQRVQNDSIQVKADRSVAVKYMEKLELDERLEELRARERVVQDYIKKARKRLLALQTRYKELIVFGADDVRARSRGNNQRSYGSSSDSSAKSSSTSSSSSSRSPGRPLHDKPEDSWKDESFGSFGQRGSSRRRRTSDTSDRTKTRVSSDTSIPRKDGSYSSSSRSSSSSSYTSTRTNPSTTQRTQNSSKESISPSLNDVPPHRRTRSTASDLESDRRRLRELNVDEEFEKLKEELGM